MVAKNSIKNNAINAFKLAMVNFDQSLFMSSYSSILADKTFREVFKDVFIPLLNEIGLLWQTDTISMAHEHFITSLIKQKILINTEKLQHKEPIKKSKIFVPFLPENEIHEIGLLYLNYEIVLRGYKSIYLGQTVPLDTLKDVMKYFDNLCFISYFTVTPTKEKIDKYMTDFTALIKEYGAAEIWLLGYQTKHLDKDSLPDYIKTFNSIEKVVEQL
jgi:methanogenic corrinoid protein MtbC1